MVLVFPRPDWQALFFLQQGVKPASGVLAHLASEPVVTADAPFGLVEIAPAYAVHGHTASEPAVTVEAPALPAEIAPFNAVHAHSASQPGVTADAPALPAEIAPADTTHGHSASQPVVTTEAPALPADIAPTDAVHGHVASEPAVTAEAPALPANIMPADALHGHVASEPVVTADAPAGIQWLDIADDFLLFDTAAGITGSSVVDQWASQTAGGGTAAVYRGSNSARPAISAGPPVRLSFDGSDDILIGNAATSSFTNSRTALMMIIKARPNSTSSINRYVWHFSTHSSTGLSRIGIFHSNTNTWMGVLRVLDESTSTKQKSGQVTVGQEDTIALVVNCGTPTDAALYVNGTKFAFASAPPSTPALPAADSLRSSFSGVNEYDGKIGPAVLLAKNSGGFSEQDVIDALAKFAAELA